MKILHTIPGLSISSGGPTTCTYNLLKGLRSQQIEADVLTFKSKNATDKIIANDSFIKLIDNDSFSPLVYSQNFNQYLKRNNDYDLYHANALWTMPSHMTIKMAHKNNKPAILAPHGMLYPQALKVSKWKKDIIYRLFQKSDLENVNCLQATCMEEVNHIHRLNIKTPVAIIPNCLNLDLNIQPRLSPNTIRRFGFIGRLHSIKNIHLLLEAWNNIKPYSKETELYIIGNGDADYEKQLKIYIQNHNLTNIVFTGFIEQYKLKEIIPRLDYLVLPSKSENFGMVVPEALANGVPVLASKGTPWEELNTYKCGWWFNHNELSDILIEAIKLPESKRIEMGNKGRELVKNKYSMKKVSMQMERLYSWILTKENKPEFVID